LCVCVCVCVCVRARMCMCVCVCVEKKNSPDRWQESHGYASGQWQALIVPWKKIWKVSVLVYFLYKFAIKKTFQNFVPCERSPLASA